MASETTGSTQQNIPPKNNKKSKKTRFFQKPQVLAVRESIILNIIFSILVPAITLVTMEWVARGNFEPTKQKNGFFEALANHFPSFLIAFIFLILIYVFVTYLSGFHAVSTLVLGVVGTVPATVTHFKMTLRNEPFLPWDLAQVGDLVNIQENVELKITTPIIATIVIFIVLIALARFVRLPQPPQRRQRLIMRFTIAWLALVLGMGMVFGVFLNTSIHEKLRIYEDMWMQDRYYRNHGVLTGFMTNLPMMQIAVPEDYSEGMVSAIAGDAIENAGSESPLYPTAPSANGAALSETPDVIFLMAESFWDVTALPGVEYDRDLLPNLHALSKQGASGYVYSPSFGGGTCDVEFEALTGFSVENLPAGSKPYQQYVTDETFSLAHVLKNRGYETMAIHGYGRRFWNRDVAYPRLGIDTFIAEDDFVEPHRRRNFISDEAMVDRIIEEHQQKIEEDTSVFIHAITMQNHTTYRRDRYPADELVRVKKAPSSIPDDTIGQLEDCATGIFEMDRALGRLTDYLNECERPTILVFWGDHMNPMSDGLAMFEKTGFIEEGETDSPKLHQTPLLIWSNQATDAVDLGTIASYEISPVMMDLYGVEKPLYFEFLAQQMDTLHARTRGVTVNPDNSTTQEMTEDQQASVYEQSVLQYDLLFGKQYLRNFEE